MPDRSSLTPVISCNPGVHFPSISSLLTQRIAKEDRSFFWGVISASTGFGTLTMGSLGSYLLGMFLHDTLRGNGTRNSYIFSSSRADKFGWQAVFYFCGFIALSWVAFVGFYLLRWHKTLSLSTWLPFFSSSSEDNGPFLPRHSSSTNSILHR